MFANICAPSCIFINKPLKPRWTSIFICRHISLDSRKPSFPTRSRSRCRDSILSHRIYSPWDHPVPSSSGQAPRNPLGAGYRTGSSQPNHRDSWMNGDDDRELILVVGEHQTDPPPPNPTQPSAPWGSSLFWLELGAWQTSTGGTQSWWGDGNLSWGGSNLPTDPCCFRANYKGIKRSHLMQ